MSRLTSRRVVNTRASAPAGGASSAASIQNDSTDLLFRQREGCHPGYQLIHLAKTRLTTRCCLVNKTRFIGYGWQGPVSRHHYCTLRRHLVLYGRQLLHAQTKCHSPWLGCVSFADRLATVLHDYAMRGAIRYSKGLKSER